MFRAPLLATALAATGCMAQVAGGATYARGSTHGGALAAAVGQDALRLTLEVSTDLHERADATQQAAVIAALGGRISVFGMWLDSGVLDRDTDWARWLDFGVEGALGSLVASGTTGGVVVVGGWADVRLSTEHAGYPTLHVAIRHDSFDAPYTDDNQLFIGIGWTQRAPDRPR